MPPTSPLRLLVLGLAVATAACSAGPSSPTGPLTSPASGTGAPASAGESPNVSPLSGDEATLTYGYGPQPAAGVSYQPDVVMVGGGAASVRAASGDGMTWTIDRNAPGAADLAVGKVMVLTSRATGRVVDIQDAGDTRIVSLGPVDLTEIVSSGNLTIDQDIDVNALGYQQIPDLPGALAIPTSAGSASPSPSGSGSSAGELMAMSGGGWDLTLPAVRLGGRLAQAAAGDQLPPALQPRNCLEVAVGSWSAKPCVDQGKVSLGIDYRAAGGGAKPGLKVGVIITLPTVGMHLRTSAGIADSQMTGTTAVLDGLKGVDVELAGGAANGLSDNDKVKVEVPIEIDAPIPPSPATLGLPLNVKIEFKYIVETAFSSKNSTLTAMGSYGLDGPLGIDNGQFVSPQFSVQQPMMDSISGIGIGVSGFVLAAKMKVLVGLGVPAATAGPYVAITMSVGVTLGSSIGIVQCRGLTVDLKGGVGFGIVITQDALKDLLAKLPGSFKIKSETEKSWAIIPTQTQTLPDVPACKGS